MAHQLPLFTPRGQPYDLATFEAELRSRVLDELASLWGSSLLDEACPECGASSIRVIPHPEVVLCSCPCGWMEQVPAREIFED